MSGTGLPADGTGDTGAVRLGTLNEAVATVATMLGYEPSEGDVALLAIGHDGRPLAAGNLVSVSDGEDPSAELGELSEFGAQLAASMTRLGAAHLLLVGHGPRGEARVVVLGDTVSPLSATVVERFGDRMRDWDMSVREPGPWEPVPVVTPALALAGAALPHRSREELLAQFATIPDLRPSPEVTAKAEREVRAQRGSHAQRAAEALALLARCGPGADAAVRAAAGAWIAGDKVVRDHTVHGAVTGPPALSENLTYLARTCAPAHEAEVNAAAATVRYVNGDGFATVIPFIDRATGTRLGELVSRAMQAALPPDELRAAFATMFPRSAPTVGEPLNKSGMDASRGPER